MVQDDLRGQVVDLGGQDEVALRKTVDLVCLEPDLDFSPREVDVGMMSLLFGQRTDTIDEGQRAGEVREFEFYSEMVFIGHTPPRDLRRERS